ncbi:Stem-specific protein TSJT1 [Apostasia shenzhenica]|uniref:Stem-specific protein TSJT1 n=1 Tax=Apostasia shenzhenica TaxID=1088818 RepID=A0A2I0AKA6_9ASPA|nr:Stem-specific protein TSJT1 [Apostasia shenzhenica]
MLAIFRKTLAHPPEELHSPVHGASDKASKHPHEILHDFLSSHSSTAFSASFVRGAAMAFAGAGAGAPCSFLHQRLFCSVDDVYCVFVGRLDNLSSLIRQYGLCGKSSDEAILVIEAYRTLRDRGPYPADQVLKDLAGDFAFVIYDNRTGSVFVALSADAQISLYWGIASDDSVVISDDLEVIKRGCGKSFAPFPAGCMFHSEGGLKSFERPMNKMKAVPRVDSEGAMCGAVFKVDSCGKITSMPRVGSAANWSSWEQ